MFFFCYIIIFGLDLTHAVLIDSTEALFNFSFTNAVTL